MVKIMENPKTLLIIDDLGVALFLETPKLPTNLRYKSSKMLVNILYYMDPIGYDAGTPQQNKLANAEAQDDWSTIHKYRG